jgi:hypothetical protein
MEYNRKTVSFANNNQYNDNNFQRKNDLNVNNNSYNRTSIMNNQNNSYVSQVNSINARPSVVSTTFNQSSSQIFIKNPSTVILPRNPSVVVKPDSLIKIEVYSPETSGTINRIYSARLAYFIKSLNTRNSNNNFQDNSFVNGGVWAKPFQNRNTICVVINGTQVVENFPLGIFNEDPRSNFQYDIKEYRSNFIRTISQFPGCRFVNIN